MVGEPLRPFIIALPGVDADSPLGRGLAHALSDVAGFVTANTTPKVSAAWRRSVRGTMLDWLSKGSVQPSPNPTSSDVLLDLHGQDIRSAERSWRIIDGTGNCVLRPFACLATCEAAPLVTSLYLIESEGDSATWVILAEAHISARRGYRSLLDTVGRTIAWLVSAGVRARPSRAHAWNPPALGPRTGGSLGVLRSRAASLRARLRDHVSSEIWAIGWVAEPVEEFVATRTVEPEVWIEVPARHGFIADPFPWPGRENIFLYEHFCHRTGLGSIEAMARSGNATKAIEQLDLNVRTHLSYPFTYQSDGFVVCLPEMAAERRQVMYVLDRERAPHALCTVAENVSMADPTLFHWEGLYWIAYNDGDLGLHENLCLMFASRLEGPWTAHPLNPVKVDVRSSRPAGAPLEVGGILYRPAQDCSDSYGCALAMNRVIACTPSQYEEEHVATLLANPNGRFPDGLHTFSVTPGGILIDGKRTIVDWNILWQRLARRLHRAAVVRVASA
jgi:hypothetical protein